MAYRVVVPVIARQQPPVLYLLEDGEAYNLAYFCSDACRAAFAQREGQSSTIGTCDDWIEGTVCDECSKSLDLQKKPA